MKNLKIEADLGFIVFVISILVLIILFCGDPDLMDALISRIKK